MRARAQRRIRIDDARSQPLEEVGFFRVNAEMAHLDLRFGPRQLQLSFENIRVVILVGQRHCLFARISNESAEGTADRLVWRNSYTPAQAEHGIKHSACRIG